MVVLVTFKNEEDPKKNEGARMLTRVFPIITLCELPIATETRVLIRSGSKSKAASALMPQIKFNFHRSTGLIDINL